MVEVEDVAVDRIEVEAEREACDEEGSWALELDPWISTCDQIENYNQNMLQLAQIENSICLVFLQAGRIRRAGKT